MHWDAFAVTLLFDLLLPTSFYQACAESVPINANVPSPTSVPSEFNEKGGRSRGPAKGNKIGSGRGRGGLGESRLELGFSTRGSRG